MIIVMIMNHILFLIMVLITITVTPTTTSTTATTTTIITGNDEYHQHHFEKFLCPSSSMIDFNRDGYFKYPIDLFYPKYLDSLLNNINSHHHHHHHHHSKYHQHHNESIDNNDGNRHHNHNYSHYDNNKKIHQIYHQNRTFMRKSGNIDELLLYIHDNSYMTSSHHHDEDIDQNEVYNCSKPDYDNANIKYHPHSHHICITNRLFKCPINIHDIIEATNFMINQHDHDHHDQHHDNDSTQHKYDTQDYHFKEPLHTLYVRYNIRYMR